MGRRALELGAHGEITATPQRRDSDTGKWVKAPTIRQAERWRARCYTRGHDGVRREVVGYGRRKADALASVEHQLDERTATDTDARLTTSTPLKRAGELWIERMHRTDSGLAPTSVRSYEFAWNAHIVSDSSPVRGLSLGQVNDPQRIRALLVKVADNHGTASARTTKTALSSVLQHAVDVGVLPHNAARAVRPVTAQGSPTSEHQRDHRRAFTREERDQVVRHADVLAGLVEPTGHEAAPTPADPRTLRKRVAVADLIAVLAGTGVRISEARLLRWDDVDLDAGTVIVRGTKTAKSVRKLSLPAWLTARLCRRAGDGRTGFVLSSPGVLDPEAEWNKFNADKAVRVVLDGAGFPWAISHSFRRTVASELHRQGAPLVRIADQLGHADPTMTASVYLGRDLAGDKSDLADLL